MKIISNNGVLLNRFAVFTAAATLALVGLGGLVTSHGVGMAVPDWPNTYGYNMFFFPISQWVGGIFYEHTHRLLASTVGLLTCILALWLYGTSARPFMRWTGLALIALALLALFAAPAHWRDALVLGATGGALTAASFFWPRCSPSPKYLRNLGLAAFFAVVLQGVLGGLRVVWLKDQIGIFHATLAQLFFGLLCSIALFTSRGWNAAPNIDVALSRSRPSTFDLRISPLAALFLGTTALILAQLILGATMRHQHAGLAIPDFPLAYGKLWPATDPAAVALYNQHRLEVTDANPITATQIILQMTHRMLAFVILLAVAFCAWVANRRLHINTGLQPGAPRQACARLSLIWLGLILTQAFLGAATIWSNKAADIATLHVLVGALSLALGSLLILISARVSQTVKVATVPSQLPHHSTTPALQPLPASPS
jgi:cytochrome c oxidase assembly protein subunit 15